MKTQRKTQRGGSPIASLIVLALLVYGGFVAFQWVPQWLESKALDNVFETMESNQRSQPLGTVNAVRNKVSDLLNINEMDDKISLFSFKQNGNTVIVEANYERNLNLLFTSKPMTYEKRLVLSP